jgi:hypothetical protein
MVMKTIRDLLPQKTSRITTELDEKTVFFICRKVILEEYGMKGGENIIPVLYKDKRLFLSPRSSLWGNEIALEREALRGKVNKLLGDEVVCEIVVSRQG